MAINVARLMGHPSDRIRRAVRPAVMVDSALSGEVPIEGIDRGDGLLSSAEENANCYSVFWKFSEKVSIVSPGSQSGVWERGFNRSLERG